jgi:hypothetical protein
VQGAASVAIAAAGMIGGFLLGFIYVLMPVSARLAHH